MIGPALWSAPVSTPPGLQLREFDVEALDGIEAVARGWLMIAGETGAGYESPDSS